MNERPIATMKMGPKPAEAPTTPVAAPATPPQPKSPTPRKPAPNPRQSEYDRLMELVEQLRGQFPDKSEREILALARKIMAKEQEDADLWANVKDEYGVNKFPTPRPPTRPAQRPAAVAPQPTPSAPPQNVEEPAYIPSGAVGVMVPNPRYGKQNGLVFDGKGWQDGSMQNQAMEAQKAEQAFLAEKRQMELDRLRMEMELERLQKEREVNELRQDPALAGLIGGTAQQGPVRPLAGRGMMY